MGDRPSTELPERYRITAVAIGAVVGMVFVLHAVLDMGLGEVALLLLPTLVIAAPMLGYYLWTSRRGGR